MRYATLVILAIFLLPAINGYCQEDGRDIYVIEYANDKRPMFDGDMSFEKLNKWVAGHLRYPRKAMKEGKQGKVIIGFTITKEGKLTDVKVYKGVHPLLDAEAVRVIKTTAKEWSCGYNSFNGEPCDVTLTCPVIFRL